MNTIKDIINLLKITPRENYIDEDLYELKLNDSDEFSRYYTILDDSNDFVLDENSMIMTYDESDLTYTYDNFEVNLVADFEDDKYKLTIRKVK